MIFEEFDPKIHNVHQVADLVFQIDIRVLKKLFKNKQNAVAAIEKKISVKYPCDLDDSFKFYVIYKDDNHSKILAILLVSEGKNSENFIDDSIFLFKKLKFMDAFNFSAQNFIDKCTLSEINEKDFYIAEIATSNSERCQGIARAVVKEVIEKAKNEGYNRVVIDVDFNNAVARKLYESLGFKVYNKKSFKLGAHEKKMYNMEYII